MYSINEPLRFDIPMKAMSCPRPRVAAGRAYMPTEYLQWKNTFKVIAKQQYKGPILEEPLFVEIQIIYQRPNSLMRKKDPASRIFKTTKPDIDNLAKAVLDGLQDAKIIKDDSQVVGLIVHKWYGKKIEDKKSERNSIKIDIYRISGE